MKIDTPRRVLIKLSGEAMSGPEGFGFSFDNIKELALRIKTFIETTGAQVAFVVGGGNFYRGGALSAHGMRRVASDHIGMLGTKMNAIALCEVLRSMNQQCVIYSPSPISGMSLSMNYDHIELSLQEGKVVLFAGGLGQPCFSTDSCASVRATEIEAQYLIKATDVDGIFESDPKVDAKAQRYENLSYDLALKKQIQVMDLTAFSQCQKADITLFVCNIFKAGTLESLFAEKPQGTIVTNRSPN